MENQPLLDGEYDFWHGDYNLMNPAPSPLDDKIIALCRLFTESDSAGRKSVIESLDSQDFSILMAFALRCAVFAMRDKNGAHLRNALIATSMIEEKRFDYRDIYMVLCVVYHAAQLIHEDSARFMLKIRALMPSVFNSQDPHVSETLLQKGLKPESVGFEEARTKYGAGFIHRSYEDYQPSYDLLAAAVDIGDLFSSDDYHFAHIEVRTKLTPVWLKSAHYEKIDELLRASSATVRVSAKLKPGKFWSSDVQSLSVYLIEFPDEAKASKLAEICARVDADHSLIGISVSRLVCVVIQSTWQIGFPPYETPESLSRFEEGIIRILQEYTR